MHILGARNKAPDPTAACRSPFIEDVPMFPNFDAFQKLGKEQFEAVTAAASELTQSLQSIAAEASDYSKKTIESNTAFVEKLFATKKLDEAIALQSEHAKSSYEGFLAQVTKMSELYGSFVKKATKPMENAVAKLQNVNR
jgi:hypothetical protein